MLAGHCHDVHVAPSGCNLIFVSLPSVLFAFTPPTPSNLEGAWKACETNIRQFRYFYLPLAKNVMGREVDWKIVRGFGFPFSPFAQKNWEPRGLRTFSKMRMLFSWTTTYSSCCHKVSGSEKLQVFLSLAAHIEKNNQIYVVCPEIK